MPASPGKRPQEEVLTWTSGRGALSEKVSAAAALVPSSPRATVAASSFAHRFTSIISLIVSLHSTFASMKRKGHKPFLRKRAHTGVPRGPRLPRWHPLATAEWPPPQRSGQHSAKASATFSPGTALRQRATARALFPHCSVNGRCFRLPRGNWSAKRPWCNQNYHGSFAP